MINREGSPLFHVEHFIEGKYIKYNSNSGYIHLDDTLRATPQVSQAFLSIISTLTWLRFQMLGSYCHIPHLMSGGILTAGI